MKSHLRPLGIRITLTVLCCIALHGCCAPQPISKSELHATDLYLGLAGDSKQSVMWATEYLDRTDFPGVAEDYDDTDAHLRAAANADIAWLEKQPAVVVRELDLGFDKFSTEQEPVYPSDVLLGGPKRQ